jgi:hypothetical protein
VILEPGSIHRIPQAISGKFCAGFHKFVAEFPGEILVAPDALSRGFRLCGNFAFSVPDLAGNAFRTPQSIIAQ